MKKVFVKGNTLFLHKSITQPEFKSESLNRTKIADDKTRETISRLIKEKFHSITEGQWWRGSERNELIKAALNLGLTDLADELTIHT